MLFDWLVTGQVVPMNPAAAVRGPKHVVKTGKTPVLEGTEWRELLDSIPSATLRDLRDRALIATLTFSFARITAALKMKVEDLRRGGASWMVRLHEKGRQGACDAVSPCVRRGLARIDAAGIAEDRKGWLFRTAPRHNADALSDRPMNQYAAWLMIRRRAAPAGTTAPIGNHTFRHWDHRLPRQWGRARTRAGNGGARKPAHDQTLRPDEGGAHPGRGGKD